MGLQCAQSHASLVQAAPFGRTGDAEQRQIKCHCRRGQAGRQAGRRAPRQAGVQLPYRETRAAAVCTKGASVMVFLSWVGRARVRKEGRRESIGTPTCRRRAACPMLSSCASGACEEACRDRGSKLHPCCSPPKGRGAASDNGDTHAPRVRGSRLLWAVRRGGSDDAGPHRAPVHGRNDLQLALPAAVRVLNDAEVVVCGAAPPAEAAHGEAKAGPGGGSDSQPGRYGLVSVGGGFLSCMSHHEVCGHAGARHDDCRLRGNN